MPLTPEQLQQAREMNRSANLNTTSTSPQTASNSWDAFGELVTQSAAKQQLVQPKKKSGIGEFLKSIPAAITSSERALGRTIGGAIATGSKEVQGAQQSQANLDEMSQKLVDKIKEIESQGGDASRLRNQLAQNYGQSFDIAEVIPETQKTGKQVAGEALGTALDFATAGTLAKGAKTFKMFGDAQKAAEAAKKVKEGASIAQVIAQNIEGTYKATTGRKLAEIGAKTLESAGKGATLGYGYDISQGLQAGEEFPEVFKPGVGAITGAAIPFGLGVKSATGIISKAEAPRIINSLIKPLAKDFSYGKNPGRAIAEEGIVANSLDDLAEKISTRRQQIGQEIGELTRTLQGKAQLSVENAFDSINIAMNEAAKTNNKTLLQRLQNVKDALSENLVLGVDEMGNPTIVSQGKKNLSTIGFEDAFKLKKDIGDLTQWTGNVSDDKAVNKALKQAYGSVKQTINDTAQIVDPETAQRLKVLNEKYADLTSAEIATKYRDIITERQNIISLPGKLGTIAGLSTSIITGQAPLTTILAGVSGAVLDKALGSTAVKTRFAKILAGEAPGVIERLLSRNPNVRDAIYRAFDTDINEDFSSFIQKINSFIKQKAGLYIDDVTKNIHPDDIEQMVNFIDYARVGKQITEGEFTGISALAEKFGISMDKGLKGVANEFEKVLNGQKKVPSTIKTGRPFLEEQKNL